MSKNAQGGQTHSTPTLNPVVPYPAALPQPFWLLSRYTDDHWLVRGASPKQQSKIHFDVLFHDGSRLTDPQHAHLLDTIKRLSYWLRSGQHGSVTNAQCHLASTGALINLALWMGLNHIHRFEHLTPDDLDAYVDEALYGSGKLLKFDTRLRQHVDTLIASGDPPPAKQSDTRFIDSEKLLSDCGIDPRRGSRDKVVNHIIFELSLEAGFYLYPFQKAIATGPRPEYTPLTNVAYLRMLQPWGHLWSMDHLLPGDKITFNPFPGKTATELANKRGKETGRTKTIPVEQAMHLFDRSIRYVLDYADYLLRKRDQFEEVERRYQGEPESRAKERALEMLFGERGGLPEGPGAPWPLRPVKINKSSGSGVAFSSALNRHLPEAGFIIIAGLTARRHEELGSIRADDCISLTEDGYSLEVWIEKTPQRWEKIPCPELVVKAVEVLRRWSAPARAITGKPDLFQYKHLGEDAVSPVNFRKALKEFVEHLEIPPCADGSRWEFHMHQLRRFFAIMYVWRYEYGELSALSHFLRHFDIEATRRYVTEATKGSIFKDVQTHHALSVLTDAAVGRRDVSGNFGERFKKVAARIRAQMSRSVLVVPEREFARRIERLIERSGKLLKGFPWGYCTCGSAPRDLNNAACLKGQDPAKVTEPDPGRATPVVCASCPHNMTHEGFKPYVLTQIEFHRKAAEDLKNGTLVRNASAAQAEALQQHYDRTFVNSKPLERLDGTL